MYYAERNNLLKESDFSIDLDELLKYFLDIYRYFNNKGYFRVAEYGVWIRDDYGNEEIMIHPTLAPSPELYFMRHLNSNEIWPIESNAMNYDEVELFTVIEILYNHIAIYDDNKVDVVKDFARKQFRIHINNVLKLYEDGYMIDENQGIVIKIPNTAMKNLLTEDISIIDNDTVINQLQSAMKMYFRFDSNLEIKKKAINILVDILEPLRDELKEIYGDTNSNKSHDSMIFGIVNKFNIRHNNEAQMTDYDKEVWYDWMVQYYTSVILTYYKLKNKSS